MSHDWMLSDSDLFQGTI